MHLANPGSRVRRCRSNADRNDFAGIFTARLPSSPVARRGPEHAKRAHLSRALSP